MSIRTSDCFTIHCDMTHDHDPWADQDGAPHFDNHQQALDYVTGYLAWTLTDNVLRCTDCTAAHQCEQDGHQWTNWSYGQHSHEYCRRCNVNRKWATTGGTR